MGVTTKDLAKICNVSRTTINRALYGGSIKEETKRKILETAKELGYQPDLVARSLVKGQSMTIGVIVVDLRNQYFPKMLDAIENRTKNGNYLLNITLHENDKETEKKLLQALIGHRVDGLILSPANQGTEFWSYLKKLPVPAVVIGNRIGDGIPTVGIDEAGATEAAVRFIFARGYEEILFVVPPLDGKEPESIGHRQRVDGYLRAARELGFAQRLIAGSGYLEEVLGRMEERKGRPAFLCSGDVYAFEVLSRLKQRGFCEKQDFGVMGFDCIDVLQKCSPVLATVDNHVEEIGSRAAELLMGLIQKKNMERWIEIPYEIKGGETI